MSNLLRNKLEGSHLSVNDFVYLLWIGSTLGESKERLFTEEFIKYVQNLEDREVNVSRAQQVVGFSFSTGKRLETPENSKEVLSNMPLWAEPLPLFKDAYKARSLVKAGYSKTTIAKAFNINIEELEKALYCLDTLLEREIPYDAYDILDDVSYIIAEASRMSTAWARVNKKRYCGNLQTVLVIHAMRLCGFGLDELEHYFGASRSYINKTSREIDNWLK